MLVKRINAAVVENGLLRFSHRSFPIPILRSSETSPILGYGFNCSFFHLLYIYNKRQQNNTFLK